VIVVQQRRPPAIGVKAPYPGFIEPALATAIDKVLKGDRWIHEIKFDGYRVQLYLANEKIKVFSLSVLQNELMGKFKSIVMVPSTCSISTATTFENCHWWSENPT
jgi:hypothetical protein